MICSFYGQHRHIGSNKVESVLLKGSVLRDSFDMSNWVTSSFLVKRPALCFHQAIKESETTLVSPKKTIFATLKVTGLSKAISVQKVNIRRRFRLESTTGLLEVARMSIKNFVASTVEKRNCQASQNQAHTALPPLCASTLYKIYCRFTFGLR